MKQLEDNLTLDMHEEVITLDNYNFNPSKFRFRFHITTVDGAVTEWTGLTAKRAKDMYAYTAQSQPSNVKAFGWEEMK